jgi:hypothetical protein
MGLFLPGEVWGKQGVIGRIHLCMLTVAWVNIASYLGVSSPPCEYIPLGLILQTRQNAIPQTHLVQLDWWTCNIHLQHPFVTSI